MQYTVNRGEKGKIEVKVDVPKADFVAAYNQAIDEFGKDAKIAGFRPGKAPSNVIEQHFGTNRLLNETASALISKHLSEILKKEDIIPLDSPQIAISSLAHGSPFIFTASFYQKPKVKIGDWRKIKIKKVKAKEITEEDINESIQNIFDAWKGQQETGNKKQETSDTGQVTNDEESENQSEEEGEETGKFIYDAQGNKIFLSDKQEAKSKKQDKIDDEFAKAIGARDLAHLREIVKKDLETIVADQVEAKLEEELFDKLLVLGSIEVPDILVEDELNRILVRLNQQLEQQKRSLDDYLAEQKMTLDELKNKWRPQAEKNVKITLVMDEIGAAEKVQVTKEELENAFSGVNQANLSEGQKADLERYIAISIFQAKTLDLVKKTVAV